MSISTNALNDLINAVILTLHRERQFQLEAAKFDCLYWLWLFLVDQISISRKKHWTCHISRIFYTGVYFVWNGYTYTGNWRFLECTFYNYFKNFHETVTPYCDVRWLHANDIHPLLLISVCAKNYTVKSLLSAIHKHNNVSEMPCWQISIWNDMKNHYTQELK